MQTLLNASAYESPALMATLFICGTLIIFLMIAVKPSEQTKSPMHYAVSKKRELPSDDHQERAANYVWLGIIAAIVIYYFI